MKFNIAYLLLLLVISPNLYGADAESSALANPGANAGFTGQTVKGLTEVVERWSQKKIPVEYVETGKGWVDREEFINKEIDSLVIFGSVHNAKKPTILDAEKNATAFSTARPLHAYHFVKSGYFGHRVNTPLEKDAEKISLSTGKSEKIDQFKKSRIERRLGSHLTEAPEKSDDDVRDGYRSQLLEGLIATGDDYDKSPSKGALKRYHVINNALCYELQKSTAALAIREKQIIEKRREAEALETAISSFNSPMCNEFVFYMNALIDVHQSENMFHQPKNQDSDKETLDFIFNAANDEFILNRSTLTTQNRDGSEHVVHFGQFMKKDGRLPVEECGAQARKVYQGWRTSFGEPTDATKLRALHGQLMAKRKELEEIPAAQVDRHLLIQNQIKALQQERDDEFVKIRTTVFEAAKQLTSKDLAAYCNTINNRTRLAFAQEYVSDEEAAIALEKQKLAEALFHMTADQTAEVTMAQAIMELINCDATTGALLAKEVAIIEAKQAADGKGKEEA